ncbi:hypothetical protein PUN28_007474 [Cardiocondyla obscurior]|uniref:Uncharacterized protein n=1 Tax=Cardiocondyla obscurior TaxID=286306 RepID=A0AAW2G564_9HYME
MLACTYFHILDSLHTQRARSKDNVLKMFKTLKQKKKRKKESLKNIFKTFNLHHIIF